MNQESKAKIAKFIKGGTYEAVGEAIKMIPGVNIVWGFVTGGKAALDELSYVRTEELLSFFEENASQLLNKNLLEDEQFLIGLGVTYETFLRQRIEEKRKIVKQVFLEFAQSEEKQNFELERMYQTLGAISLGAISFLNLLSKHALDRQKEVFEGSPYKNVKEYWGGTPSLHKEHPISVFLQAYKDSNISLGRNDIPEDELSILKYEDDFIAELVGLSIIRYIPQENIKVKERTGKTELKFRMDYSFTGFGLTFLEFIIK